MARFYHDRGIPEVEHFARACCIGRGLDPDKPVQETGYDETTVPLWWKYQDAAWNFIIMLAASRAETPEPTPAPNATNPEGAGSDARED